MKHPPTRLFIGVAVATAFLAGSIVTSSASSPASGRVDRIVASGDTWTQIAAQIAAAASPTDRTAFARTLACRNALDANCENDSLSTALAAGRLISYLPGDVPAAAPATTTLPATTTTAAATTTTVAATTTTAAATTTTAAATTTTAAATTTTAAATTTTAPATTTTTPGQIPANQLPTGNPGSASILIQNSAQQGPSGDTSGNFRFFCGYSNMSYDDPIVWPNQPGKSHLHMFFGNKNVTAATRSRADLTAPGTKGTCSGGAANLSGYWMPVLMNGATPVKPKYVQLYYKSGYRSVPATAIRDIPEGLVMLAGSAAATNDQSEEIVSWECTGQGGYRTRLWSCGAGNEMSMTVIFPQCWDGVNLDSADHRSHMAYPTYGAGCPSSHPVALPVISLIVYWTQPSGAVSNLRLASDAAGVPAGVSAHADYIEGWDRGVLHDALQHCVREKRDCTRGLGDARQLVDPSGTTFN